MGGWDWRVAGVAAALLLLLNAAAFTVPWALGARNLEAHEE
jgi:hypothetical protein